MAKDSSSILVADDDSFTVDAIRAICEDLQLRCSVSTTYDEAQRLVRRRAFDNYLIDLAMPIGSSPGPNSKGGFEAGVELLRLARKANQGARLICMTGHGSAEARSWCERNGANYLVKPLDRSRIELALGLRRHRGFVVHGRNDKERKKVERALRRANVDPIVLFAQPQRGRTVLEKFEDVAGTCDCAVVAVSADDIGGLATGGIAQRRARQNVILELGYFLAHFGRKTGRTIYIEFGQTEIPSNVAGLVRIDGHLAPAELVKAITAEVAAFSAI